MTDWSRAAETVLRVLAAAVDGEEAMAAAAQTTVSYPLGEPATVDQAGRVAGEALAEHLTLELALIRLLVQTTRRPPEELLREALSGSRPAPPSEPQPLQLVADLVDLYAEVVAAHHPVMPTAEQWAAALNVDHERALVRAVGTTPLELAALLNAAALGHLRAAALALRAESFTAASVPALLRSAVEASATMWWLCEHDPNSPESLRRLAAARVDSDRRELGRGHRGQDGERIEVTQASLNRVRTAATRLQLGKTSMPDRTQRVHGLLGDDAASTYDFLSGLAHAEPADIHHVISYATGRATSQGGQAIALVAAVTLEPLVRAHRRAFVRYLEAADYPAVPGPQLDEVLDALLIATDFAAQPLDVCPKPSP